MFRFRHETCLQRRNCGDKRCTREINTGCHCHLARPEQDFSWDNLGRISGPTYPSKLNHPVNQAANGEFLVRANLEAQKYGPPDVGMLLHISAIASPTDIVNTATITQPQTMTAGPPVFWSGMLGPKVMGIKEVLLGL